VRVITAAIGLAFTDVRVRANSSSTQENMKERLQRSNAQATCAPKLNPEKDAQYWFDQPGAPKPKLANEKPKGETVSYNELLKSWEAARK